MSNQRERVLQRFVYERAADDVIPNATKHLKVIVLL